MDFLQLRLVSEIIEQNTWKEVSAFRHLDVRSRIRLQLIDGVASLADDRSRR